MRRDERDDVAPAKSPLSTSAVRRPRSAASRAIPAPVIPPPMTSTSTGSAAIDASARARVRCENGVSAANSPPLGADASFRPGANYTEVTSLVRRDGRVRGATVQDALTGEARTVRALIVVNATGPWVDALRRLDDPQAPPLLRLTKGAHVAVPRGRIGNAHAVTLTSPIDGRVMVVP